MQTRQNWGSTWQRGIRLVLKRRFLQITSSDQNKGRIWSLPLLMMENMRSSEYRRFPVVLEYAEKHEMSTLSSVQRHCRGIKTSVGNKLPDLMICTKLRKIRWGSQLRWGKDFVLNRWGCLRGIFANMLRMLALLGKSKSKRLRGTEFCRQRGSG